MVAFVAAAMLSVPLALAQLPPGSPQRTNPGMNATQEEVLAKEIAGLRSRLAQLQTVLGQRYPSGRYEVGVMPVGMPMEKQMGMAGSPDKPAMNSGGMPMPQGCCAGMMGKMGKMGAAGSPTMTMPSDLPGFPGASHIYHVGATGFFLDHPEAIQLTAPQQASLNGIKEKTLADQAAGQRKIDQAEQELWMLTSSDRPDLMKIEAKVRELEQLEGDRRITFIRSVGEAARVLTDAQRVALLGTNAPQGAPMPAPQGSAVPMNPQGAMPPADPQGGTGGMGHM